MGDPDPIKSLLGRNPIGGYDSKKKIFSLSVCKHRKKQHL